MKSFYRLVLAVLPALWSSAAGPVPYPTGNVFPVPQRVYGEFTVVEPAADGPELRYDRDIPALRQAAEIFADSYRELVTPENSPGATRLKITFGLLDGAEVGAEAARFGVAPETVQLPEQGYLIRFSNSGDTLEILAAGADLKGTFYAVMSLRQMLWLDGGTMKFRIAAIDDYPAWTRRIAGDYAPQTDYAIFAENKISHFGWQWRDDFRKFLLPDAPSQGYWTIATVAAALDAAADAAATGLIDLALITNIYIAPPLFNVLNEKDLDDLEAFCRLACANGFTTLYIGADDHTRTGEGGYICHHDDEAEYFDHSVGRAHGRLMRRLYDRLAGSCPGLKLRFVPAPYSLLDHEVNLRPANQRYLLDYSAEAPPQVGVVWTGRGIYTPELTRADHDAYSRYLPGRPELILWDNLEERYSPMPLWEFHDYPEHAADAGGELFINAHTRGWEWSFNYAVQANAYLWNPAAFDFESSAREVLTRRYGPEKADLLWRMNRLHAEARRARDRFDRATAIRALEEVMRHGDAIGDDRIVRFTRERLAEAAATPKTLSVPLADGWDRAAGYHPEKLWYASYYLPDDHLSIYHTGDALHLAGDLEFLPEIPRPHAGGSPRESNDYITLSLSPGGERQLDITLDAAGNRLVGGGGERIHSVDLPVGIRTGADGDRWRFELRIPYATLQEYFGRAPSPGDDWRANYIRTFFNGYNGFTQDHYQGIFHFE